MIRKLVIYALSVLCVCCSSQAQEKINSYSGIITADAIKDDKYSQALSDLQNYLKKITGKEFLLHQSPDANSIQGIVIKLNKAGLIATQEEKKLNSGTSEDFVLSGNTSRLLIVGKDAAGLCHGIYTYLDMLGVKWYFPDDQWEFVPHKKDISISLTKYCSPSFHIRDFFGTGGIVSVPSVDPDLNLRKLWADWKRRNRFGGDVTLAGHYGEAFNDKYREVLSKHPEYLAMIKGHRVGWAPGTKLCISNKAVQQLYIEDRVSEAMADLAKDPQGSGKITISVEPSDGDGDCECDVCRKMGTVSDRDFFLANEVARRLEKISPRLYANMYAYNTHAAPPSFNLSTHLLVQIVPYAFQRVASPEEFIQAWQKKANSLMIYDYYGIPDWHYNLPLTDNWALDHYLARIRNWQNHQIKGFTLESSYSIGSNGIGLYLASRLGWDINTNINQEKSGFYQKMFGGSASMIKFFEKLMGSFNGSPDLPFLLDKLIHADAETKNNYSNRIASWESYLHYLLLYYRFQNADPSARNNRFEELMSFIWRIYPDAMVHTTRLSELYCDRFQIPTDLVAQWDVHKDHAEKISRTSLLSRNELQELVANDLQSNPVLRGFAYEGPKSEFINTYPLPRPGGPVSEGIKLLEFPQTFVRPGKDGHIEFWLRVNEGSADNETQDVEIEMLDSTGLITIQKISKTLTNNWTRISFVPPANKLYQIHIQNLNWIQFYSDPSQWLGFKTIPIHSEIGKLWFYVPGSIHSIYYTNTTDKQPVFRDGKGNMLTVRKINDQNIYEVSFPTPFSQPLSMEGSEYKYLTFYSIPGLFFPYRNYRLEH